MTIQIPDDLARGLEGIAASQDASSPAAVLRAVRELPHPSSEAMDDLDAAIRDDSAFGQL
jgi:predicted transcriptional regulator